MEERTVEAESAPAWAGARSAKDRNAVLRSVSALLDALAPEQTLTRAERERERIERYRTPTGCVLQGPTAALSVSWFAEGLADSGFGELHVIVWTGVVTRRGMKGNRPTAVPVTSLTLRPDETRVADGYWRETDDVTVDTPSLARRCLDMLEAQLAV